MSLRVVLVVLSGLSALVTATLGVATLVDPLGTAARFGVEVADDPVIRTILLTIAGLVLSLAAVTALAARWVHLDLPQGRTLMLLVGGSLLLVAALGGWVGGSRPLLLVDGLRGAVLLPLAALYRPGTAQHER